MRSEVDSFSSLSGWLPLETLHISACFVCVCSCDLSMRTHLPNRLIYLQYIIHYHQLALTVQHQQGRTALVLQMKTQKGIT